MTSEHRSQVIVMLVGMFLTGTAMIGSATWYLSSDIDGVREANLKSSSDLLARLSLDEGRISSLERADAERHADDEAFQSDVRAQLALMLNQLSDLKVGLAGKENLRSR